MMCERCGNRIDNDPELTDDGDVHPECVYPHELAS